MSSGPDTRMPDPATDDVVLLVIDHILRNGGGRTEEMVSFANGKQSVLSRATKKLNDANIITRRPTEDSEGNRSAEWVFMNPDQYRGKTAEQVVKEIFGKHRSEQEYHSFQSGRATIILTRQSLAPIPSSSDNTRLTFRRVGGQVWLSAAYFRAMLLEAARIANLEGKQYNAFHYWNRYDDALLDDDAIEPSPEIAIAPEGKGFSWHESLRVGTEITFDFTYPSSVLKLETIARVLVVAGRFVGFSPAKHGQGWGKFKVASVVPVVDEDLFAMKEVSVVHLNGHSTEAIATYGTSPQSKS